MTVCSPRPPRRYLSIWLRRLATDRIERRAPLDAPLPPRVIVAPASNALRLVALNDAAAALGLVPGIALADARAMHPALAVAEADAAGDRALLEALADWCDRYTPLIALDTPDGLTLDIAGCAHLFGGEEQMRQDILRRLTRQGLKTKAVIADTPGGAWAVARFGDGGVVGPGATRDALLPLPLAGLRLAPETLEALRRVGLTRIGDVAALPRAPLAARFGTQLLRRLDRALGAEEEATIYRRPPPPYMAERTFAEPLLIEEGVLATAEDLARELGAAMEKRAEGARAIELALFRVDGAVARVAVGTGRPVREASFMRRLLAEKLASGSGLEMACGLDLIRLSALATEPMRLEQLTLAGAADSQDDFADLVDRLAARLGPRAVMRLAPRDAHVPELAAAALPAQAVAARVDAPTRERGVLPVRSQTTQDSAAPARPLRLLERPEPIEAVSEVPDGPPVRFRWRRVLHAVARAEGPERIAMEWWRDGAPTPTRDYFRVETADGLRCWLFREGLYERETVPPLWFLHGLFA